MVFSADRSHFNTNDLRDKLINHNYIARHPIFGTEPQISDTKRGSKTIAVLMVC